MHGLKLNLLSDSAGLGTEVIAALSVLTVTSILVMILAVFIIFWYKYVVREDKVRPKGSCFDSDGLGGLKA